MNKNEIKELIQKSVWGGKRQKEIFDFPIEFFIYSVYNSIWDFVYRKIKEPIQRRVDNIKV